MELLGLKRFEERGERWTDFGHTTSNALRTTHYDAGAGDGKKGFVVYTGDGHPSFAWFKGAVLPSGEDYQFFRGPSAGGERFANHGECWSNAARGSVFPFEADGLDARAYGWNEAWGRKTLSVRETTGPARRR